MFSRQKKDDSSDHPNKRGLFGLGGTRSARNTGLNVVVKALGLKPELDAYHQACERLFKRATSCGEITTDYKGPCDAKLLKTLKGVLDTISSFQEELLGQSALVGLNAALDRQRVDLYTEQLEDAWSLFHADITFRQKLQAKEFSLPFPIDQISPILPTYGPTYVGHEAELKRLVALLRNTPSARVIILGTGGIGKTAMATQALFDDGVASEFANRRFFIDCNGVVSAEGIAAALASVFNVIESPGSPLQRALLDHLRSLRVRVLIVLDNLESAWLTDEQRRVEQLVSHICCIDHITVVVTMRGKSPPDGIRWHQIIDLEPLGTEDARTLFTELRQSTTALSDDHDLRELLRLLDGLPLAITLLASVGITTGYTSSMLLAAYRTERTAMVTRGLANDHVTSLDISISLSINSRTMQDNPEALILLGLLSLLPDGLRDKDHTLFFPTMTKYRPTARVLVQVALCTLHDETYRVLAPIREYIQAHHPPDELQPHLKELCQYYFRLALRGGDWEQEPSAVLHEVRPHVNNILSVLGYTMATGNTAHITDVLQALDALSGFSERTAIGDCKPYLQAALSAYQACSAHSNMKRLLATCRLRLGKAEYRRDDYEAATAALVQARVAFQDVGDHLSAAQCLQSLGDIMDMRSDYDRATATLNEAKAAFEDIGNRVGAAQCLQRLGDILYMRSDYDGATATLKEAKAAFEDIGNRVGAAQCLRSLGDIMYMRSDYDGATATLNEAKAAFEDIGDRVGAAQCLQGLGNIMYMRNNYDGATATLKEAKAAFEDIGDRVGAAQCLRSLGDIMYMRSDYDGATATLKEAKAAFEDIGDRVGAAQCLQRLGNIMYMRNNYDGATATLNEAKAAFEDIGDRVSAAQCLQSLGNVMYMRSDYDGATATLKEAKAAFEDIGSRVGAAQCLQRLGDIMTMRDDYDGATATLKEAKAAFEDIGDRLGAAQCLQSLGDIMNKRDDYDGATVTLNEAKAAFEDIGDSLGAAHCTTKLGDVRRKQGWWWWW